MAGAGDGVAAAVGSELADIHEPSLGRAVAARASHEGDRRVEVRKNQLRCQEAGFDDRRTPAVARHEGGCVEHRRAMGEADADVWRCDCARIDRWNRLRDEIAGLTKKWALLRKIECDALV